MFLNFWPLPAPAPETLSAGTRGLLGEPKLYAGNPAALRLPPGSPADWPSGRSGTGLGKPQPTGVRQAFPCRPLTALGTPGRAPGCAQAPLLQHHSIDSYPEGYCLPTPRKPCPPAPIDFQPRLTVALAHGCLRCSSALVSPTKLRALKNQQGPVSALAHTGPLSGSASADGTGSKCPHPRS